MTSQRARLAILERRVSERQRPRMSHKQSLEELEAILAQSKREDEQLLAEVGEVEFAKIMAQREQEMESRDSFLRTIELEPEWLRPGFDFSGLTEDQCAAVFLRLLDESTAIDGVVV